MADYKVVDTEKLEAGLIATADAIREKTGNIEKIDWKENGMADQVDEVFEAGKKSEYDAFWDAYQENGNRKKYEYGFCGGAGGFGWDDKIFKPKYDIILDAGYSVTCMFWHNQVLDLPTAFKNCGIIIDTNKVWYFTQMFQRAKTKTWGILDCSNAKSADYTFTDAEIEEIEKIILNKDCNYNKTFTGAKLLYHMVVEGVIGKNGFDVSSCPLDKPSLTSIINALSPTASDLIVTLSLSSVNNAFETSPGAADGSTSEEWLTLANTKPNWTISLV